MTALWAAPQNYARFLAAELGLVYRGPVLVVMPAGYGIAVAAGGATAAAHTLDRLPAPSRRLGAAAIAAAQRVAAASGHALPNPAISARTAPGSSPAVPWLVFLLGTALIVLAWAASLRARPLSFGWHPPRPQGEQRLRESNSRGSRSSAVGCVSEG